jgi:hypothetical protein
VTGTPPDQGVLEEHAGGPPAPPKRGGKCEECAANRARLIGLAADVVGFRRQVERLDIDDLRELPRRLDQLELILVALAAYLVTSAIIDARREVRDGRR